LLVGIGDPPIRSLTATPVDCAGEGACLGDVEIAAFRRLVAQRHIGFASREVRRLSRLVDKAVLDLVKVFGEPGGRLRDVSVFPKGKHDDQVDSTAQFLDWFKKPMPQWRIYEASRQRALALEQQRKPQPTKTVFAPGSMEWLAEQEKAG
jgi:hypothetical protein